MKSRKLSSTNIIGANVVNSEQESIGSIHSLVIDQQKSSIMYAILAYSGSWWGEDRYYAFPLKALQFDATDDSKIVLDIDKETLEKAPDSEKYSWPVEPTDNFIHLVFDDFDSTPHTLYNMQQLAKTN